MGRARKFKALRKISGYNPSEQSQNETIEGKSKVYAQIVLNDSGEPEIRERVEKAKQTRCTGAKKIYRAYKRAMKDGIIKV